MTKKQRDAIVRMYPDLTNPTEFLQRLTGADDGNDITLPVNLAFKVIYALELRSADGDEEAARGIQLIAHRATSLFQARAIGSPHWFPFTSRSESQPVLIGPRKPDLRDALRVWENLRIGADVSINVQAGKQPDWDRPTTAITYHLVKEIERQRHLFRIRPDRAKVDGPCRKKLEAEGACLPPLSRDEQILPLWRRVVIGYLPRTFGENYEDHRAFKSYLSHHTIKDCDDEPERRRTLRKLIQDDISKAIEAIAPKKEKGSYRKRIAGLLRAFAKELSED